MNIDTAERKKQKKLDKTHWMCRIQKFTLGIDAPNYYIGYCPFFWMTWLCLALSPFMLLARVTIVPFINLISKIIDKIDEKKKLSYQAFLKIPLSPTYDQLIFIGKRFGKEDLQRLNACEDGFMLYWYGDIKDRTDAIRMTMWFKQNPNWKTTHLPAAKKHQAEMLKKQQEIQNIEPIPVKWTLRNVVNAVSLCGAVIFKVLIPILIIAVVSISAYAVYCFCIYCYLHITVHAWFTAFMILCAIAAGIIAIKIIASAIDHFYIARKKNNKIPRIKKIKVKKPGFFTNLFTFAIDTIKITYKQECPLIIWGKETGSIEKRDIGLSEES